LRGFQKDFEGFFVSSTNQDRFSMFFTARWQQQWHHRRTQGSQHANSLCIEGALQIQRVLKLSGRQL
jgi:hypothetical protein